ncbi:MAG: seg [Parcubacteria group bacterium]|nr:seg [Parcubacteria group bacterium]
MADIGQNKDSQSLRTQGNSASLDSFVLDKGIFSNIFEKDIQRVYIYKKAERLAKAIHLITPAFRNAPALRNRMDLVAVGLVDAAILPPHAAREGLSRELLALSSVLSIARTGGMLSNMNADLIAHEAHQLLQEIAAYEEPRIFMDDAPTLASLAKSSVAAARIQQEPRSRTTPTERVESKGHGKGQIKDSTQASGRRQAILDVLRSKGPVYIKDISTVIRDVSEKTIQRELSSLVEEGTVSRSGERRWTTYSLT